MRGAHDHERACATACICVCLLCVSQSGVVLMGKFTTGACTRATLVKD